MDDELLSFDDKVLDDTANSIERYSMVQSAVMQNYFTSISTLAGDWTDDHTFGTVLEEISTLNNSLQGILESICQEYPRYFRAKAEDIRNRP